MTINELEQAIRNLISTQSDFLSNTNMDAVNSSLSVIYSYREMLNKVNAHPFDDELKTNLTLDLKYLENNITVYVCEALAEKGINLLLYIPANSQAIIDKNLNIYGSEKTNLHESLVKKDFSERFKNQRKLEELKSNTREEAIKQQKLSGPPERSEGRDFLLDLLKK